MTDTMAGPARAKNGTAPDIFEPYVARIEAALASDGTEPGAIAAQVEQALADLHTALAPRRQTKRIEHAVKALDGAHKALRARKPEALRLMREALAEHRKAHGLPPAARPRRRFGLAAALEDRPAPKTVCRKLEWEVGRPPMLIGPPGAGKTFVVQAAALDLACGRPLWGCPDFHVPGYSRVLHVDLDQGANKTLRRFKRLLRGRGIDAVDEAAARAQLGAIYRVDPRDLGSFEVDEGEGLRLLSLAPEEVARWRGAWTDAARGFDVAFVDSLRRLAPFLDENDSRFSMVPDVLREVSELAQTVIVLLHHASNKVPAHRGSGPRPAPGTRGSSAIDGAAGSQLAIDPDGDLYRVTQVRAGEAKKVPPFFFAFEDDPPSASGLRGIRVVYQTAEQAKAPEIAAKGTKLKAAAASALSYIVKINTIERYGPTRKQVVADVPGRDKDLWTALDMLVQEKRLRVEKDGRHERLWAVLEAEGTS